MINKQVLVTGGTGFIGSRVVEEIRKTKNYDIFVTSRKPSQDKSVLVLDLTKREDFLHYKKQLDGVEYLVHAATAVAESSESTNMMSMEGIAIINNLIASLPRLKRVVYISSTSAAFASIDESFYGLAKLMDEVMLTNFAKIKGLELVVLRFPQVFGPDEPHEIFISKFLKSMLKEQPITVVNDGLGSKDLIYIDDVASCTLVALNSDKVGIYTITPERPSSVRNVIAILEDELGTSVDKIHKTVAESGSRISSLHLNGNSHELGYNIRYTLREGLAQMVAAAQRGK